MKKTLIALAVLTMANLTFAAPPAAGTKDLGGRTPPAGVEAPPEHGPGRGFPEKMTREEALKRAAEQFDMVDQNKDGVVTREELHQFKEKLRPALPLHGQHRMEGEALGKHRGHPPKGPEGAHRGPDSEGPSPKGTK